jgi:branched-chain amino acid transport system ATP-binding protein
MSEAIRVIWQEHANISRVLDCLRTMVNDSDGALDPDLLAAILNYMEDFADTMHHPKEEHYLLPALVKRRPDLALLVEQVQEEHDRLTQMLDEMRHRLDAYRADAKELDALRDEAEAYVELQLTHMAREDRGLLPIALEELTDDDWRAIDEVFTRHNDPLFGAKRQKQFDTLFEKIVAASPGPIV